MVTGFYAGRTHNIIPNTDCALGVPVNRMVLETVLSYMRAQRVSAYQEATGKGLVRHVLIRCGFDSKEIMVCLVINGRELPGEGKLVSDFSSVFLSGESFADGEIVFSCTGLCRPYWKRDGVGFVLRDWYDFPVFGS